MKINSLLVTAGYLAVTWKSQPFQIATRLPADVVAERLRNAPGKTFEVRRTRAGGRRIRGFSSRNGYHVSLAATGPEQSNGLMRVMEGSLRDLDSHDGGCELSGIFVTRAWPRRLITLTIAFGVLYVAALIVTLILGAQRGHVAVGFGPAALFVGVLFGLSRLSVKREHELLDFLRDFLSP
jgi:hypothetical protein